MNYQLQHTPVKQLKLSHSKNKFVNINVENVGINICARLRDRVSIKYSYRRFHHLHFGGQWGPEVSEEGGQRENFVGNIVKYTFFGIKPTYNQLHSLKISFGAS